MRFATTGHNAIILSQGMWNQTTSLVQFIHCSHSAVGTTQRAIIRKGTTPSFLEEEHSMAWVILFIAGLLEVAWALFLKQSEGFTRTEHTIGFAVTLSLSMFLLSQALKTLPVGTAYAVWTGIGAAGTAIIGMVWLGESREVVKLVSLVMLLGGILGLRLTSSH